MTLENDNFIKIANQIRNPYIDEWKKANKKVVGYYCTYIPEELLHAADLLPFRIRSTGNEDTDLGDVYMVRFTCSFVRMTLDLALKGGFDFLDGLIMSNCCDHARRMFELFDLKVFKREIFKEKPPNLYIPIPHVITDEGFEYFKRQVARLKREIEESFTYNAISKDKLNNSIQIYNKNRALFREINKLRGLDIPKLNGSLALKIAMANASIPKEHANLELERLLNVLKDYEGIKLNKKRIMLIGSVVDNTGFINIIENSGAIIVSDFLCFGTRNYLDDVKINNIDDPLSLIAERVYYRISCPRMMDDHRRRLGFIKDQIRDYKVDGVILERINNCDLHGCENMMLEHELKELEIPVYSLDRENFQKDYNRIQTRIEAFLEML
ncbi:MAG: 2-hydroxyacyl-CoA dehydratase subunit D [Promethearchaeota archaeon]